MIRKNWVLRNSFGQILSRHQSRKDAFVQRRIGMRVSYSPKSSRFGSRSKAYY
jgi:hypothetical protein